MTDKHTLTILATSDLHGHVYPTTYRGKINQPLGIAKLATLIERERRRSKDVVLIDNGDVIQGSPLMAHFHGSTLETNPIIKAMNQLDYDAAVIGNHEFNFGRGALDAAVLASRFPWLSANILDQSTNAPLYGKPYLIKETPHGVRVAILGVTTHAIPNWEQPRHLSGIAFTDAFETTQAWVNTIREREDVDVLVVSYHGGFERDLTSGSATEALTGENQGYRILKEIDGIDVLLTGHQHRKIAEVVGKTAVLQPGVNGEALGKVTLDLIRQKDTWTITAQQADLMPVTTAVPASAGILIATHRAHHETEMWLDQPVGLIDGDLSIRDPFQLRLKTHPFIALINHVQMDAAGVAISLTSLLHDQAPGLSGAVTLREIVSNYIYPNTLTVLELTGKDIKLALEQSATYFQLDDQHQLTVNPAFLSPKPAPYNYDMWAGIEYQLSINQPPGQRVQYLHRNGQPVQDGETFPVVMNSYRASGGGNFELFKDKPVLKAMQTDMTDLLVAYFSQHPTIEPSAYVNFTVTTD